MIMSSKVVRSFIILLLCLIAAAPCLAQTGHRVTLGLYPEDRLPETVILTGAVIVQGVPGIDSADRLTLRAKNGNITLSTGQTANRPLRIVPKGNLRIQATGQPDAATNNVVVITPKSGRLQCTMLLDIEDYVSRVLAREMPGEWPLEARSAQAVAIRSFALASRGRHAREGYDLCALTHCQLPSLTPVPMNPAAVRTRGFVLLIQGRPTATPFSSTCGGHTADGAPIGMPEWLVGVDDTSGGKANCQPSPHATWKATLTLAEMARVFGIAAGQGGSLDVQIVKTDSGGRVALIRARGGEQKELDGGAFLMAAGRTLGWARVKSASFKLSRTGNSFVLEGKGLGHGCGLCQWGAKALAQKGTSWQDILAHYYPKASVGRW